MTTNIGSGLGGATGAAAESTWGTYVAADHFYKATKATVKSVPNFIQGTGFASGQIYDDLSTWVRATNSATGDLELQFGTKGGHGLLLSNILGLTPTPVQQAATTAYLQTYTLDSGDSTGMGMSMQTNVPQTDGTVVPYSLNGGKVTSATFACQTSDFLTLAMTLDGQNVVDTEAEASASFDTGIVPFHFGEMSVKLGTYGSEALVEGVRGMSLTFDRPLKVDSYYANGTPTAKGEQIQNDRAKITGSIDIDFVAKADFVDRFLASSSTSMVIDFKGALIESTYYSQLTFTLPGTVFTGDNPGLESNDVVQLSIPFESKKDATHGTGTCTYMSTDTAL